MRWLRGIPMFSLFPHKPLQWIGPLAVVAMIGAMIGLGVAILIGLSGAFSFAATTADPAGFAALVHGAFLRSTDHHADQMPAPPADLASPAMIVKGAGYYGTACAHCHGAPGSGRTRSCWRCARARNICPRSSASSATARCSGSSSTA